MRAPAVALGLTIVIAGIRPEASSAAVGTTWFQDLESIKASGRAGARWIRESKCYALQVWLFKPTAIAEQNEGLPQTTAQQNGERGSPSNISSYIANLRGLEPTSYCSGIRAEGRIAPSAAKDSRIDVWLLRADGSEVQPADNKCDNECSLSASYRYHSEDGDRAIAVAIRIDDAFYIEKLPSLSQRPDR